MDCYTIGETAERGITVHLSDEEGPHVRVGSKCLRLSEELCQRLERLANKALEQELTATQVKATLVYGDWALSSASLTDSMELDSEQTRDRQALVLLLTQAPPGLCVQLTGRSSSERLNKAGTCVITQYEAFPPPGVQVLLQDEGATLLRLSPYSGFRIVRRTPRAQPVEVPPLLMVNWTGRRLLVYQPTKRFGDVSEQDQPQ